MQREKKTTSAVWIQSKISKWTSNKMSSNWPCCLQKSSGVRIWSMHRFVPLASLSPRKLLPHSMKAFAGDSGWCNCFNHLKPPSISFHLSILPPNSCQCKTLGGSQNFSKPEAPNFLTEGLRSPALQYRNGAVLLRFRRCFSLRIWTQHLFDSSTSRLNLSSAHSSSMSIALAGIVQKVWRTQSTIAR